MGSRPTCSSGSVSESTPPTWGFTSVGTKRALPVHRIEEQDRPPSELFMPWLMKTQPWTHWERGIDEIFLREAGGDGKVALDNFLRLFAEFGRFQVVSARWSSLTFLKDVSRPQPRRKSIPTRIQLWVSKTGPPGASERYWDAYLGRRYAPGLSDDAEAMKKSIESEFGLSPDAWRPASALREVVN